MIGVDATTLDHPRRRRGDIKRPRYNVTTRALLPLVSSCDQASPRRHQYTTIRTMQPAARNFVQHDMLRLMEAGTKCWPLSLSLFAIWTSTAVDVVIEPLTT